MNSDFCLAVHAVVFLHKRSSIIPSEELAKNICTNPARVRKVMAKLKQAEIIEAAEGIGGGYRLRKNAEEIALSDISKATNTRFVKTNWHSGNINKPCLISSGMGELMDNIFDELNDSCFKQLSKITITDIENKIFSADKGNTIC